MKSSHPEIKLFTILFRLPVTKFVCDLHYIILNGYSYFGFHFATKRFYI